MGRALAASDLQALIDGRMARDSGIPGWALPYVIFEVGESSPQNTMGSNSHNLRIVRVNASLYAASAPDLDALEVQWRRAARISRRGSPAREMKA